MFSGNRRIESFVIQPIRYNFFADLDFQFEEGFSVVFHGEIEPDTEQEGDAIKMIFKIDQLPGRYAHLAVDSLFRQIPPAPYPQAVPDLVHLIPKCQWIFDEVVLIKRERRP